MPPMLTSWTQEGVELAVEPAMGVEGRVVGCWGT